MDERARFLGPDVSGASSSSIERVEAALQSARALLADVRPAMLGPIDVARLLALEQSTQDIGEEVSRRAHEAINVNSFEPVAFTDLNPDVITERILRKSEMPMIVPKDLGALKVITVVDDRTIAGEERYVFNENDGLLLALFNGVFACRAVFPRTQELMQVGWIKRQDRDVKQTVEELRELINNVTSAQWDDSLCADYARIGGRGNRLVLSPNLVLEYAELLDVTEAPLRGVRIKEVAPRTLSQPELPEAASAGEEDDFDSLVSLARSAATLALFGTAEQLRESLLAALQPLTPEEQEYWISELALPLDVGASGPIRRRLLMSLAPDVLVATYERRSDLGLKALQATMQASLINLAIALDSYIKLPQEERGELVTHIKSVLA